MKLWLAEGVVELQDWVDSSSLAWRISAGNKLGVCVKLDMQTIALIQHLEAWCSSEMTVLNGEFCHRCHKPPVKHREWAVSSIFALDLSNKIRCLDHTKH